jgi:hypothetical protein
MLGRDDELGYLPKEFEWPEETKSYFKDEDKKNKKYQWEFYKQNEVEDDYMGVRRGKTRHLHATGAPVDTRGRHSDKFSCCVRPTAEPRSKIFGLSDREPSRAELSNCPKIARLGSRLGSRALFRTNSDTGQPSSRDSRDTFLSIFHVFFIFLSNHYFSKAILCIVLPSNLNIFEK